MTPRCELVFYEAIRTQATREHYQWGLKSFMKFADLKDMQSILSYSKEDLQIKVEDFIMYQKKRISRSSIKGYLSGLKLFLEMNDVLINWTKVYKLLPEMQKLSGGKAYTNDDVREFLSLSVKKKYVALVHFLASSGIRIASIVDLKMKHLETVKHGCKSVLVYADTKDEYMTFISPEAVEALDDYLEKRKQDGDNITPESYVFVKQDLRPLNETSARAYLLYQSKKLKCRTRHKSGNRFDKQLNHGFRKRFNTILKSNENVNLSLSEKLMGHSVTVSLDNHYFDPTNENLFNEYLKALPQLLVAEKYKLETENLQKQQRIEALESQNNEIKQLKNQMLEMQAHVMNINSKS